MNRRDFNRAVGGTLALAAIPVVPFIRPEAKACQPIAPEPKVKRNGFQITLTVIRLTDFCDVEYRYYYDTVNPEYGHYVPTDWKPEYQNGKLIEDKVINRIKCPYGHLSAFIISSESRYGSLDYKLHWIIGNDMCGDAYKIHGAVHENLGLGRRLRPRILQDIMDEMLPSRPPCRHSAADMRRSQTWVISNLGYMGIYTEPQLRSLIENNLQKALEFDERISKANGKEFFLSQYGMINAMFS